MFWQLKGTKSAVERFNKENPTTNRWTHPEVKFGNAVTASGSVNFLPAV